MDLSWPKRVFILLSKFLDDEVIQQRSDVLEVGHVSGGTENGVITNGMKALNIPESREGTIRRWWAY